MTRNHIWLGFCVTLTGLSAVQMRAQEVHSTSNYQMTVQELQLKAAFDSAIAAVKNASPQELLDMLNAPDSAAAKTKYQGARGHERNSSHLEIAGGWMRRTTEDILEKKYPFAEADVDTWKMALQKVWAFTALLERDSKRAFLWLKGMNDTATPSFIEGAYCGVVYSSSAARETVRGKWKWEESAAEWKSYLHAKNPLLRSLALNFADYFATPDEIAAACFEDMDTEWSYLHELAIEKLDKLDSPDAQRILERYVADNKAARAGDRAEKMRQKAQDALARLKARGGAGVYPQITNNEGTE